LGHAQASRGGQPAVLNPRVHAPVAGVPTEDVEKRAKSLHKRARKKFRAKQFWQCSTDLITIVDYYGGYSKIEEVIFLLGNSLYELEVYSGADKMYRYLLSEVAKNSLIPDAILGLQKSRYQLRDYQQSLRFFKALETHYPHFDGIHEARYYAGQTYFHLEKLGFALNLFSQVDSDDDFYPFALYSRGLIHLKKKAFSRPSMIFSESSSSRSGGRNVLTSSIRHG